MSITYKKETGFSREYQSDWNLDFAIREIIQNHVYALQVLQVDGSHSWDNGIATFADNGQGIAKKYFLNGNSGQREIINSPGQFGEGMKLAFLIFAREGKVCKVDTVGYSMEAMFEYNEQMACEELFFNFSDSNRTCGTTFTIECTETEYLNAIQFFGFLSSNKSRFITSNFWQQETPELYVNGVKLNDSNIKMLFSYNLIGKDLNNRDRNSVNTYKLNETIWEQIIFKTEDKEYIKSILENFSNSNYVEYYNVNTFQVKNQEAWKQVAKDLWGKKVVYSSGNHKADTEANYRKFKVLPKPNWDCQQLLEFVGIQSAITILKRTEQQYKLTQLKDLSDLEKYNIKEVRKLIQKHYADVGNMRYVEDLSDEHENKVNGFYDPKEDLIFLEKNILSSFNQLFETLLHETIHKVTRAEDCSERFQNEAVHAAMKFALGCTREKRK